MLNTDGFAIIDFETTGLSPEKGDRVIQVGIVRTDMSGEITSTWSHLINPRRKVTALHVHGITDEMVQSSPHFEETVEGILHRIENRIIVAHNAEFDGHFLDAEMSRAGHVFHTSKMYPIFDTKIHAVEFTGLENPKLEELIKYYGFSVDDFGKGHLHDAETDAIMTAMVLKEFLKKDKERVLDLIVWP